MSQIKTFLKRYWKPVIFVLVCFAITCGALYLSELIWALGRMS
jgi:hypothetical protein